ncbi:MAG: glycosyltransferase family 2 protein [Candidatus Micrarchaeota archaeon]
MLNILVPMAGKGSRFAQAGYTFPKPLIEVRGKPMIQVVIEDIRPSSEHRFIFICQKEHVEKYGVKELLQLISPGCIVIAIDKVTEGAACTALLASDHIANEDELLIANSDQYVQMDINSMLEFARKEKLDGAILTFPATHPKWSFVKTDEKGYVVEVAEKKPISNEATVGIYYYKTGNIFVNAAKSMIRKNIRVNNEFYVCPAYNEMILEGLKIKPFRIKAEHMHGLGTPEDLEKFVKSNIKIK